MLCEIDVQATLRQKLGIEREPYLILGACNPRSRTPRWRPSPSSACSCPCNVVVYEQQGQTHIAAVDAEQMLSIVGNDELADTASEVDGAVRTSSTAPRRADPAPAAARRSTAMFFTRKPSITPDQAAARLANRELVLVDVRQAAECDAAAYAARSTSRWDSSRPLARARPRPARSRSCATPAPAARARPASPSRPGTTRSTCAAG